MMVVSNSCGIGTLKFDNVVGVFLREEARRKSSKSKTSGSALSVDRRGRSRNKDKKRTRGQNSNRGKVHPS